jgi:hypothetical protein
MRLRVPPLALETTDAAQPRTEIPAWVAEQHLQVGSAEFAHGGQHR